MIESLLFLNFAAILLLAAILSLYNLRQARALEQARTALEDWVMLQIRRHREAKAKEVLVPEPLAWAAAQLKGDLAEPLELVAVRRVAVDVKGVELTARDGRRVVIGPLDAAGLSRAQRPGRGRVNQAFAVAFLEGQRPLLSRERSLLNAGDTFDLEAAQAGQHFNLDWSDTRRLWFHVLAPRHPQAAVSGKIL